MKAARTARDFKASDALRAELADKGILVEITKDGIRWRRKMMLRDVKLGADR